MPSLRRCEPARSHARERRGSGRAEGQRESGLGAAEVGGDAAARVARRASSLWRHDAGRCVRRSRGAAHLERALPRLHVDPDLEARAGAEHPLLAKRARGTVPATGSRRLELPPRRGTVGTHHVPPQAAAHATGARQARRARVRPAHSARDSPGGAAAAAQASRCASPCKRGAPRQRRRRWRGATRAAPGQPWAAGKVVTASLDARLSPAAGKTWALPSQGRAAAAPARTRRSCA